jgi:hypothetical protein
MKLRSVILAILSGAGLASVAMAQARCNAGPLTLQVLGSGGPFASGNRASSGYLVWRDGRPLVMVDAGGQSDRLRKQPLKVAGPSGAGLFPPMDAFIHRLFDSTGAFPILGGTVGQRGGGVRLDVVTVT